MTSTDKATTEPAASPDPGGAPSAQARFGTFGGVFTPCVLTILGVIMFQRSGFVVGEIGLVQALVILVFAKTITTLTTLSLSAIATNTRVGSGGIYYMVSRTLGPAMGGAIGVMEFIAQAVSIAFYVIGFSEALFALLPAGVQWTEPLVSTAVVLVLFLVTFKGADLAIKTQYYILLVLMLSVATFLVGGLAHFDAGRLADNMSARPGGAEFWVVFAIFFPAATGMTAGANMSGDLKDPARSIPNGTLLAIGFTAAIYLAQIVLLAAFIDRGAMVGLDQAGLEQLGAHNLRSMAGVMPLIVAGVFAATLSSALGCFLGAPRILQAMGKDRLLRVLVVFGRGHGPADEPRVATVLSMAIAVGVVWLSAAAGGLSFVAEIIAMFFLIAYGMINLAAFVEGRGGNPSFRPRFKRFGWSTALVGALACAIAMVKINETYAIIAMLIAGGVYLSMRGRVAGDWVDAKRGYVFSRTRENLHMLETMTPDPKNWRPALMVLTEDAERDRQLIQCASWIESGRGLLSVLEVASRPDASLAERLAERERHVERIRVDLRARGVVAFADSVVVDDGPRRLDGLIQAYSIGSLRPNTVMISLPPPSQVERRAHVADMLRAVAGFNLNVVLYKGARSDSLGRRRIDVWWHGQKNGSLLALFAYLAHTHPDWARSEIRMLRIVRSAAEKVEAEHSLERMMAAARLEVNIDIVISDGPVADIIAERSGEANLVLMGLQQRNVEDLEAFLAERDGLLTRLPPTLLVLSNGDADLLA